MSPSSPPLANRFLRLSLINILSNITVPIAGLVDVAFLGHLAEVHHLGGVALATVLFNYLYWTFGFLRMGTTGMTAQAVGRGDPEEIQLIALRNGAIACAIGLLILILQYPIRELGFFVLQGTDAVKAVGQAYYQARIWGAFPSLLNYVLIGWFLGREKSDRVLILTLLGNITNIALDYLFIARWGWGGGGAGLATALSQYVMLMVGLGIAYPALFPLRRSLRQIFKVSALQATFNLNGNLLIRTFALITIFAGFINLSSTLGPIVLATNAVLLQVVTLASYFIDGMAFATESLAGIFHGASSSNRSGPSLPSGKTSTQSNAKPDAGLQKLLWLSGSTSLMAGLTFALIFNCFPTILFGLLTSHQEVRQLLPVYTPWLFPILGFGAVAYMLDGYFLGLTAGKQLRQSTVVGLLIGFIPVALLGYQRQSVQFLWLALTLSMVGRAWILGKQVPHSLRH